MRTFADLPARLVRAGLAVRLIGFDFDGVFTDNAVYVSQDGTEMVRCSRSDGIGLRAIERLGILPVIVSSETNPVVAARSRKLQVRCIQGCRDKRQALEDLVAELNLTAEAAAFVGNDVNDEPALRYVGLPIIVQDAHPAVAGLELYRTILPGGYGAVREVCDLIAGLHADPALRQAYATEAS